MTKTCNISACLLLVFYVARSYIMNDYNTQTSQILYSNNILSFSCWQLYDLGDIIHIRLTLRASLNTGYRLPQSCLCGSLWIQLDRLTVSYCDFAPNYFICPDYRFHVTIYEFKRYRFVITHSRMECCPALEIFHRKSFVWY